MGQFSHDGVIYEEMADGQVRVVGYDSAPSAATYGPPPTPKQPTPQTPTQQAIDEARLDKLRQPDKPNLPTGYEMGPDGKARLIDGLPPPRNAQGTRAIPQNVASDTEGKVSAFNDLDRALRTFDDKFSGPGSGIESAVQGWLGTGTPGQRDWWADFRRTDNITRNALFGASLSGGEKAAYAATTITPDMTPGEIRRNLQRRMELARSVLERHSRFLRANGYEPEAIDALLGNMPQPGQPASTEHLDQSQVAPGAANAPGGGNPGGNPMSPDQQAAYDAFWKVNPNATPDQLRSFGHSIGFEFQNAEDVVAAKKQGRGVAPGSAARAGVNPDVQQRIESEIQNTGSLRQFGRGMANTVMFGLDDEFKAGVDALGGSLRGEGSFGDLYGRNVAVERGVQDRMGGAYTAGQLVGALAVPLGIGARGAAQMAYAGAIGGAAYGFGSAEGNPLQRAPNALLGGVTGAAVGAGLGYAGNALTQRAASRAVPETVEAADAAGRLGIQPMPADVGGPATRLATAGTAQTMLGAGPIVRGSQRAIDQAAAARGRIAEQAGGKLPIDEAGEAVRKGGENWIKTTSARASRLYDKAEQATNGVTIQPANAIAAIDQHIADLGQANGLGDPLIKELQKVRSALENGISVTGLRQARTMLGGLAQSDALRGTNANRIFREVLNAASQDIQAGLAAQGKGGAARMLRTADKFWAERVEHIDSVLEPIIGKGKSGEDILRAVEGMAQGNRGGITRLSRLLSSLPADEAGHVRATLIDRLGRATKDNGETDAFSAARFVTQWGQMSPKAKAVLFGNSATRQGLDDLAKVAGQMKAADRYRNFSNTGGAVVNVGSAAAAGAGIASGQVLPVIAAAALNYATGRLLASPAFTRALVRIARTRANPQQALGMLSRVGTNDPAVRGELQSLIQRVANDNLGQSGRVAASPDQRPEQEK